ncbi:MAG: emp24/gp25L/p24 family protein [Chloroflexi bacterium]|nr:emp24/gp25L/p24 family protein [Chloroflexota bacterium]
MRVFGFATAVIGVVVTLEGGMLAGENILRLQDVLPTPIARPTATVTSTPTAPFSFRATTSLTNSPASQPSNTPAPIPTQGAMTRRQVVSSSERFEVAGKDAYEKPVSLSAGDKIDGSFSVEYSEINFALWMIAPVKKLLVGESRAGNGYHFSYDAVETGDYLFNFENGSTPIRKYINLYYTVTR